MPRYILHHLHFPHFGFRFDNTHNLKMLYGIRILRELMNNLCLFFVPLYLFQIAPRVPFLANLDINDFQKGMALVGIFFLVYRMVILWLAVPIGKLVVGKVGFKSAFLISRILTVVTFLLFRESVDTPILVLVAAAADGLEATFFWPLFYSIFGKNSKSKRVGEDLGLMHFLLHFVSMIAPAIGGVVAVVLGFDQLFLFGMVLAMISVVFAVSMDPEKTGTMPSYAELWLWLKENRFRRLTISYIGRYINDCVLTVWPLYVFILLQGIEKVGFLYSMSMFIAMILSFFIGFYIDHHHSKRPFFFSGGLLGVIWFLRMRIIDIWSIALVDVANRLVSSFHWLFYESILIKRGSGNRVYPFFVYREVVISVAGILWWSFFIGLFLFSGSWTTLFLLAAVGIILSLLMSDKT